MARSEKAAQRKAAKRNKRAKQARKNARERTLEKKRAASELIEPDEVRGTCEVHHRKITPTCIDTSFLITTELDSTGVQRSMQMLCSEMRAYDYHVDVREKIERYGYYLSDDALKMKRAAIRGIVADVRFGWEADELREFDPLFLRNIDWDEQKAESGQYLRSIMLLNPFIYDIKRKKTHNLGTSHLWLNIRDCVPREDKPVLVRLYDTLTAEGAIHHYAKGEGDDAPNRWSLTEWTPMTSAQTYVCNGRPMSTPAGVKRLCTIMRTKPDAKRVITCRRDDHELGVARLAEFEHPTARSLLRPSMLS